jgi:hypothetical protein
LEEVGAVVVTLKMNLEATNEKRKGGGWVKECDDLRKKTVVLAVVVNLEAVNEKRKV